MAVLSHPDGPADRCDVGLLIENREFDQFDLRDHHGTTAKVSDFIDLVPSTTVTCSKSSVLWYVRIPHLAARRTTSTVYDYCDMYGNELYKHISHATPE